MGRGGGGAGDGGVRKKEEKREEKGSEGELDAPVDAFLLRSCTMGAVNARTVPSGPALKKLDTTRTFWGSAVCAASARPDCSSACVTTSP